MYVMQQHDFVQRNIAYIIVYLIYKLENQFQKHLWWILVKRFANVFIFLFFYFYKNWNKIVKWSLDCMFFRLYHSYGKINPVDKGLVWLLSSEGTCQPCFETRSRFLLSPPQDRPLTPMSPCKSSIVHWGLSLEHTPSGENKNMNCNPNCGFFK